MPRDAVSRTANVVNWNSVAGKQRNYRQRSDKCRHALEVLHYVKIRKKLNISFISDEVEPHVTGKKWLRGH